MKLTFIGTDHEVTGSCHFLEVGTSKILIDCGMEQGNDVYQNAELSTSYHGIDYIFLTHAHIGHTDILPWICTRGSKGRVIATCTAVDLCNIMLRNGAHIQKMEAEQKNRKARRTGHVGMEALYTMEDVESVLKHFEGVAYSQEFKLNNNLTLRFTDVDYLLGSTSIEVWATKDKKTKKIVFSGDVGNKNKPLIRDPQYISEANYVVMESTYGNCCHRKDVNYVESLIRIIQETLGRSGNTVIPVFAVRRTQELLYLIRRIRDGKLIQGRDGLEVYVDNPLAVGATHVPKENVMECYNAETRVLVERGISPIDFPGLRLPIAGEESKNISSDMTLKVIIPAAGMCDVRRIHHHLKYNLQRQGCSIAFAGYRAEGTLGRMLQNGTQTVKIFGEKIDIRAHIETMDGISGHADRDGLITWVSSFEKRPGCVFVAHGDGKSYASFADVLNAQLKLAARAPYSSSQYDPIRGCWIKEIEPVLIEKETATGHKATGVYTRPVNAGRLLMDMISHNQGGTNKDLVHFTEQILTLCNKWGR